MAKCYPGIEESGLCGVKSTGSMNSSPSLQNSYTESDKSVRSKISAMQSIGAQDLRIPERKR